MHNNSNIRNKQMVINTCKIYPFSKFRGLMPAKWPLFLVSRIRASHWKNTPFFAKMGRSVVYVLLGSRRAGVCGSHVMYLPVFLVVVAMAELPVLFKDMGKTYIYLTTTKHSQARNMWKFHRLYGGLQILRYIHLVNLTTETFAIHPPRKNRSNMVNKPVYHIYFWRNYSSPITILFVPFVSIL